MNKLKRIRSIQIQFYVDDILGMLRLSLILIILFGICKCNKPNICSLHSVQIWAFTWYANIVLFLLIQLLLLLLVVVLLLSLLRAIASVLYEYYAIDDNVVIIVVFFHWVHSILYGYHNRIWQFSAFPGRLHTIICIMKMRYVEKRGSHTQAALGNRIIENDTIMNGNSYDMAKARCLEPNSSHASYTRQRLVKRNELCEK